MIALPREPSDRQLRQFAAVALVFGVAVGAWIALAGGSVPLALGLAGAGLALAVAGGLRPKSVRLPFLLLTLLTAPIGFVLSHLVLGILYYAVVTPTGLLLRLFRRDPLRLRRTAAGASSYWEPRERGRDPERYLRQA